MRGTNKAVEKWKRPFTSALHTHVLERGSLEKGPKLLMIYSKPTRNRNSIISSFSNLQPISWFSQDGGFTGLCTPYFYNRMQASPTSE